MRKVTFQLNPNIPESMAVRNSELREELRVQSGIFHGLADDIIFQDNNCFQRTFAVVESEETGKLHKVLIESVQFIE